MNQGFFLAHVNLVEVSKNMRSEARKITSRVLLTGKQGISSLGTLELGAVRYARVLLTYGSTATSRRSFGRTSELELNPTS